MASQINLGLHNRIAVTRLICLLWNDAKLQEVRKYGFLQLEVGIWDKMN